MFWKAFQGVLTALVAFWLVTIFFLWIGKETTFEFALLLLVLFFGFLVVQLTKN